MRYEGGEFVPEPGEPGFVPPAEPELPPELPPEQFPASGVTSLSSEVLTRLEQMSVTLEGVARRLQDVAETNRRENRRTRRYTLGLGLSLAVDVVLTVVVTLLSLSALSASSTLHQSQLTACGISNQTRAEQRQFWAALVSQHKLPPVTVSGEPLLAYIDKTFASVNCAAVYHR